MALLSANIHLLMEQCLEVDKLSASVIECWVPRSLFSLDSVLSSTVSSGLDLEVSTPARTLTQSLLIRRSAIEA
jgi:hypothetical protein